MMTRRTEGGLSPVGRQRRALLMAVAAFPLSGCAAARLLETRDPTRMFTLTPATGFTAGLPRVDWQLLVETPLANSGLDTSRIALTREHNELDYFAGTSWVDRAPQLVQHMLIESFENTNRIVSVGREVSGLRSDFILKTELRDFQAEYGTGEPGRDAPTVHVRLTARLVAMPRRNIVASDSFQARVRAESARLTDIIGAFDTALEAATRRTVEWTLRQGVSATQA